MQAITGLRFAERRSRFVGHFFHQFLGDVILSSLPTDPHTFGSEIHLPRYALARPILGNVQAMSGQPSHELSGAFVHPGGPASGHSETIWASPRVRWPTS